MSEQILFGLRHDPIFFKNICLIGGTGSLGNALINRYRSNNKISVISRCEFKQFTMRQQFPDITFHLGDMRDKTRIAFLLKQIDPHIIIICGALKHIDICEDNISECLATNVTGVQNIINVTLELKGSTLGLQNLQTVLQISTDKSCSPTSVYGMSKAIAERIVIDASKYSTDVHYLCVRYGNVLNSRGSIIPKFLEVAKNSHALSFQVTDRRMTRFFMTLAQSVNLIENAIRYGESGDIWIPQVPAFKISDLAQYFSTTYQKPLTDIILRPGEKLHECLVNMTEAMRTQMKDVNKERFLIIKPCYKNVIPNHHLVSEYTSEEVGVIITETGKEKIQLVDFMKSVGFDLALL